MQFKRVGLASDHAGKELKQVIFDHLRQMAMLQVSDYGVAVDHQGSVDYPDYAAKVARAVSKGELDGAIAICGTGIGMSITANRFPRVFATTAWDEYSCRVGREHNNSNILCLGARTLTPSLALALVDLWLATPFAGERHLARLQKIQNLEKSDLNA